MQQRGVRCRAARSALLLAREGASQPHRPTQSKSATRRTVGCVLAESEKRWPWRRQPTRLLLGRKQ